MFRPITVALIAICSVSTVPANATAQDSMALALQFPSDYSRVRLPALRSAEGKPDTTELPALDVRKTVELPALDVRMTAELPALDVRMTAPAGADWQPSVRTGPAGRGPVLPSLYVGFVALQVYDGYSTSRGLENGAIESNPFMASLARHPAALWAAKGGAAFVSIYMAERLWRQNRRGQAIAVMLVSNGLMAAVAAGNRSIVRAQK